MFGKMSEVDVIEQVNTRWERRRWTGAGPPPTEGGGFKFQPDSTLRTPHPPAALQNQGPKGKRKKKRKENEKGRGRLAAQPAIHLLLFWNQKALQGFSCFN